MINWDKYRRNDGTINLVDAFHAAYRIQPTIAGEALAVDYLECVEQLQLIRSRQVAASILATTHSILWLHSTLAPQLPPYTARSLLPQAEGECKHDHLSGHTCPCCDYNG